MLAFVSVFVPVSVSAVTSGHRDGRGGETRQRKGHRLPGTLGSNRVWRAFYGTVADHAEVSPDSNPSSNRYGEPPDSQDDGTSTLVIVMSSTHQPDAVT